MKTIFISAKSKEKVDLNSLKSVTFPKNLAIAYSIQYKNIAHQLREELSKKHNITAFMQVLGCSHPRFPKNTKAVLLVSNGKFHAVSLAYESKLPVYLYSHGKFQKIPSKEVETLSRKHKGALLKFLNAKKVGVLISTKPGQENLNRSIEFVKKYKDKNFYFFIANNIDISEFENFQIDAWINTACPRMDMNDATLVNISKI